MFRLEDLQPNAAVRGILPDGLVTVVSVQWFGSEALELTYKTPAGKVANELLYRHDEPRIEVVEQGRPWSFDGDGALFRLVSEAHRIRLAYLFDPTFRLIVSSNRSRATTDAPGQEPLWPTVEEEKITNSEVIKRSTGGAGAWPYLRFRAGRHDDRRVFLIHDQSSWASALNVFMDFEGYFCWRATILHSAHVRW